jgi:hypothetical protein
MKSLAPDGTPCTGATQGLLLRSKIIAGRLIPVAKETDRRWEQGEDPSMLDSENHVFEKQGKMAVADVFRPKEMESGRRAFGDTQVRDKSNDFVCDFRRKTGSSLHTRNLQAYAGRLRRQRNFRRFWSQPWKLGTGKSFITKFGNSRLSRQQPDMGSRLSPWEKFVVSFRSHLPGRGYY